MTPIIMITKAIADDLRHTIDNITITGRVLPTYTYLCIYKTQLPEHKRPPIQTIFTPDYISIIGDNEPDEYPTTYYYSDPTLDIKIRADILSRLNKITTPLRPIGYMDVPSKDDDGIWLVPYYTIPIPGPTYTTHNSPY